MYRKVIATWLNLVKKRYPPFGISLKAFWDIPSGISVVSKGESMTG